MGNQGNQATYVTIVLKGLRSFICASANLDQINPSALEHLGQCDRLFLRYVVGIRQVMAVKLDRNHERGVVHGALDLRNYLEQEACAIREQDATVFVCTLIGPKRKELVEEVPVGCMQLWDDRVNHHRTVFCIIGTLPVYRRILLRARLKRHMRSAARCP